MLQVSYIRDNREKVLERLAVKNFKQPELVDEVIQRDNDRRQTQSRLDGVSAEANSAAKQIGELMRAGKKDEAEGIKAKTSVWFVVFFVLVVLLVFFVVFFLFF